MLPGGGEAFGKRHFADYAGVRLRWAKVRSERRAPETSSVPLRTRLHDPPAVLHEQKSSAVRSPARQISTIAALAFAKTMGVAFASGLIFTSRCLPPSTRVKATHWPSGRPGVGLFGVEFRKRSKGSAGCAGNRELLPPRGVLHEQKSRWSPAGDWIAYPSANGMYMISPDDSTAHKLTARKLLAFAFSKDGAQVYGILRSTAGEGGQWRLYAIDVKPARTRCSRPWICPRRSTASMGSVCIPTASASSHPSPNGRTISGCWKGFDQPKQTTWLDRLLR